MKKGINLERLVYILEKLLGDKKSISVTPNAKLKDRTNGRLRQHDVLLTIKERHHEVKVAIECRDRSRPITINQVQEFDAKCKNTGVHQGVIVSSNGFYNSARESAKHLGIRCLELSQAESFNWLLTAGMPFYRRKLKHCNWSIYLYDNKKKPKNFVLVSENGTEITMKVLNSNITKKLEGDSLPIEEAGPHCIKFLFKGDGIFLLDKDTGEKLPVKHFIAKAAFAIVSEFLPFTLYKYLDIDSDKKITDAAFVPIELGSLKGHFMFTMGEDGGMLSFVEEPDLKQAKGVMTYNI